MIDYHELKVALRALGFPAKKQEVLQIVQRYDVDDIGRVSKKQFVAIMTQKYAERDPEDEIRKAFQLFDADNTGRISLKNMQVRIVKFVDLVRASLCPTGCALCVVYAYRERCAIDGGPGAWARY